MWSAFAILLTTTAATSPVDLQRAHKKVPGVHAVGDGHVGMTLKLNAAIRGMKDVKLKSCDEFTNEELKELQRKIHEAREPALEAIYRKAGDLGRRMGAFGKFSDNLGDIEGYWAEEAKMLQAYPQLTELTRDRKCHEAIMWLVHHVNQEGQRDLRKKVTLPLLPQHDWPEAAGVPESLFPPGGGLGCDSAHATQTTAKNSEYVEWPKELTYSATAHGAFPFWDNGGPGCSHCDPSVDGSAQLKAQRSFCILTVETCRGQVRTAHRRRVHATTFSHRTRELSSTLRKHPWRLRLMESSVVVVLRLGPRRSQVLCPGIG